jgi:guanine deaminase
MNEVAYMTRAIALSRESVGSGGGPFGAVVVRDGRIIGEGVNRVVPHADPTAHAEIVAIRAACQMIGNHVLDDAVIYTSSEPCPMCLAAIWWARMSGIVFGNSRREAAAIGFDDENIYNDIQLPLEQRKISIRQLNSDEAYDVFRLWLNKADRVPY